MVATAVSHYRVLGNLGADPCAGVRISQFGVSRGGKRLALSRGAMNRDVVLIRDVR